MLKNKTGWCYENQYGWVFFPTTRLNVQKKTGVQLEPSYRQSPKGQVTGASWWPPQWMSRWLSDHVSSYHRPQLRNDPSKEWCPDHPIPSHAIPTNHPHVLSYPIQPTNQPSSSQSSFLSSSQPPQPSPEALYRCRFTATTGPHQWKTLEKKKLFAFPASKSDSTWLSNWSKPRWYLNWIQWGWVSSHQIGPANPMCFNSPPFSHGESRDLWNPVGKRRISGGKFPWSNVGTVCIVFDPLVFKKSMKALQGLLSFSFLKSWLDENTASTGLSDINDFSYPVRDYKILPPRKMNECPKKGTILQEISSNPTINFPGIC